MRPLKAVNAFLDRRESGETLAAFRIAIGLCVLLTVGSVVAVGGVELVWLTAEHGGYRPRLVVPHLFDWLGISGPEAVWGCVTVSLAGGVLLIAGLGGRLTALVTGQAFLALTALNSHVGGGYENLLSNALWLLVLVPATATWSLDSRILRGSFRSDRPVPVWCRALIVLQLTTLYASTGLHKIGGGWSPVGGFDALYYVLSDVNWHRFQPPLLGWLAPLTRVMTASAWFFELSWLLVPVWLGLRSRDGGGRLTRWAKRVDPRGLWTVLGLVLHLGIFVTMEVGTFSEVTLAFYLALWSPDEVAAAADAALRRVRGSPSVRG